eukprot:TRINITY_DN34944_c0_g1_i1.p1 TRINITY_DN34944_c0_g1~~TRINITY_DN34944_c0_g1_i1.p1  ORF type:complete len:1411 (-),score=271.07 TRINITY_DN34944_c0_g1_i1:53-3724(-)
MGTDSTLPRNQLAAFVEAVPPPGCEESRWVFEAVKYQISVVNWKDYRQTITQCDMFTFTRENSDRGWHKGFVKGAQMTQESGWLNEQGELCLRASCSSRRPLLISQRKPSGFVGLKNHGATCYMNCLLQTLFCLGHFRHVAYSIDLPEVEQTQPVVSSDGMAGRLGLDDDPPALPLLVSLQNLFYRLQTSDVPVSCRELMRSFGWDTADAFMQHDAQELNRLLVDRLEEQMKGTANDGEMKRLFEGEFENFIECVDVNYRSQRNETFYDLQLNLRNEAGKDITSLEESLRDFCIEEMLEGDNAYDAGSEHGKQRARKGIRFKRFPPVLYIQLKRFMFDPEKMDMCKLNGRMEYPRLLDLGALAEGSGQYMLHTVIVHSGGVSSGHYYAFVRVRDGEAGKACQWVKFDDENVTFCSEQAAIEDNYGGEDLQIWNYFNMSPKDIRSREVPSCTRIHNAYMLSYVRIDKAEELLAPPVIDGQEQKYRLMVERCTREAKLAEERKRARAEQAMRVEVRVVLERDLMKMKDFFTQVQDIPVFRSLKMRRDDNGEDVCTEVQRLLLGVHENHWAPFVLSTRQTRQERFKQLTPGEALGQSVTAQGSLHGETQDPCAYVLALVARGYDLQTLQLTNESNDEGPDEIAAWDEDLIMLIVKYYCPVRQLMVTLGCWYSQSSEPLQSMIDESENWVLQRLQPYLERGEVAPLPADVQWTCWEEFLPAPKDILPRDIQKTIKEEGLYCGDILVWQPQLPGQLPGPVREGVVVGEDDEPVCATVRDFAEMTMSFMSMTVKLFMPEAPWCPDGMLATGTWSKPVPTGLAAAALGEADSKDVSPSGGSASEVFPGEVACQKFKADVRSKVDRVMMRAKKVLGLSDAQRVWLFAQGTPSMSSNQPIYRTEAAPEFADEYFVSMWQKLSRQPHRSCMSAVVLPPAPPQHRPVAVHFFDGSVVEVHSCILHVPSIEDEEQENIGPAPDAPGGATDTGSGRPALQPDEVLALARRHLRELPGEEGRLVRQRLARLRPSGTEATGIEPELPALRLVDARNGRIHAVHRSPREDQSGSEGSTPLWPARGDNFFFEALRVEPDVDIQPEAEARPSRLVEVFHLEQGLEIAFGHPFLVSVPRGESTRNVASAVQARLELADKDLRQLGVRFLLADGRRYSELREDSEWPMPRPAEEFSSPRGVPEDWDAVGPAFCIERPHPMYHGRAAASHRTVNAHKPLTIRAK